MEYLEIKKELIPYDFEIDIDGATYKFEVNYNDLYDFFTLDVYKNETLILYGEKLIYAKPLFLTSAYKEVPYMILMPYDLSEQEDRVTYENLDESVFLYIIDLDDMEV